ncbi:MAG: zinc ribbon domain-containing protein [bacterium]
MYSLIPGEKVHAERRICFPVFAVSTGLILLYFAFKTITLLVPKGNPLSFIICLAAWPLVILLLIRLYRRTLFVITDLRVVFTIDVFALSLSKSIPIEKILGVTRLDMPFIKALFKSNLGFLFFTTGNLLTMICFPLIAGPEEVEDIFNRLRFGAPADEPQQPPEPGENASGNICPECGTESAGDRKFCKKCGAKISRERK